MKCPVCSDVATRHFDHQHVYWFCHHCWQKIPGFEQSLSPRTLPNLHKSEPILEQLKARIDEQRSELVPPY